MTGCLPTKTAVCRGDLQGQSRVSFRESAPPPDPPVAAVMSTEPLQGTHLPEARLRGYARAGAQQTPSAVLSSVPPGTPALTPHAPTCGGTQRARFQCSVVPLRHAFGQSHLGDGRAEARRPALVLPGDPDPACGSLAGTPHIFPAQERAALNLGSHRRPRHLPWQETADGSRTLTWGGHPC